MEYQQQRMKFFFSRNILFKPDQNFQIIQLSDDFFSEIRNKLPCYVAIDKESFIIYNNSTFFIILGIKDRLNKIFQLIKKLKIITLSNTVRNELLSIGSDINIISEKETNILNSYLITFKDQFDNLKVNNYQPILDLLIASIIYENVFSNRKFVLKQFQDYDTFTNDQIIELQQKYYQPFYTSKINYQKQNRNLFTIIDYESFNETYYINEKKFVQLIDNYREKKCKVFKNKVIDYDSNFPIVNSFVSSKKYKILHEFIWDYSLEFKYMKEASKISLVEKFIYIINAARSINLIHSLGFIYRNMKAVNYWFRNEKSKAPILIDLSTVMHMKMMNDEDPVFGYNDNETYDIGTLFYFSPEKLLDPNDSSTRVSFASDVYSLGILIYFIIIGKHPAERANVYNISDYIQSGNLSSLKTKLNKLNECDSCTINNDLYNLQEDDIESLDFLYRNCIISKPDQRLTIREFGLYLIQFIHKVQQKDYIKNNLDQNDLITLQNCTLGLIDELSSPIPFIKGLSDSYYVYSPSNELENFYFFLIDHEILLKSSFNYILQIKPKNFGTFHFDKSNNEIQNLTLCIEKYAIIVKNNGNLIHDFIHLVLDKLKQIKLIPTCESDSLILKNKFLNEKESELKIVDWQNVLDLSLQIEKVVIPKIERKKIDIREPKLYSLAPLISYLIIEHYFYKPNAKYQINNLDHIVEIELNNQKLLLDIESYSLIIKEEPGQKELQKLNSENLSYLTQDVLLTNSKYTCYHFYPYTNDKNPYEFKKMTEDDRFMLAYKMTNVLDNLQKNKLFLSSLTYSDIFIFKNEDEKDFDFKLRIHNNITSKSQSNLKIFKKFIQKVDFPELNAFIQKYENDENLTFEFINNYLYSKYISNISSTIKYSLTNLLSFSFDSLPYQFNGNDILPQKFLGYYSKNVFNFDFYNLEHINARDVITPPQKLPFITYEFIDDKYFVACIEKKAFFLKDCSSNFGKEKIKDLFSLFWEINPNATLIPVKDSDKNFELFQTHNNFFNTIDQLIIQKNIEKAKQMILHHLHENNCYSDFLNYLSDVENFLNDFFSILSPVISYTIFRHCFPTNEFEDKSFFHFPLREEKKLINFTDQQENLINLSLIGNGSISSIYLVVHLPSLHPLAMKEYNLGMLKYFEVEKKVGEEILKYNDTNILAKFYGYIDKKDKKSIIMPFYPNGSYEDIIKEKKISQDIDKLYDNIKNNGVDHLHKMQYIHRDIKPDNILFDNNFEPVIIDFNGAISFEEKIRCKNHISEIGSYQYSSPQLLGGEDYDSNTDVYSLHKVFLLHRKKIIS